jgi:hypothetical protein
MKNLTSLMLLGGLLDLPSCVTSEDPTMPLASEDAYRVTPLGLVRAGCVHEVEDGAEVGRDDYDACDDAPTPTVNGWVEAAWWDAPSTPTKLSTTWTVPPAPTTYHGQTVFFFPSFEPAAGGRIVQPVLQYGPSAAGGGQYWAIASWYVGTSTVHSTLQQVNAGDTITGTMTTTGDCSTGSCKFVIVTRDVTSSHSRTLSVYETEPYTAVQAGVLEAYQINACSDLPAATTTKFSKLVVDEPSGAVTPPWSARNWSPSPSCVYGVTHNGSTVTLSY